MSGCTVSKDGQLLNADQIQFYNDPNDDFPISGPGHPLTAASSQQHPRAHPFRPLRQ
jgi:hypothetical protein